MTVYFDPWSLNLFVFKWKTREEEHKFIPKGDDIEQFDDPEYWRAELKKKIKQWKTEKLQLLSELTCFQSKLIDAETENMKIKKQLKLAEEKNNKLERETSYLESQIKVSWFESVHLEWASLHLWQKCN